MAATIKIGPLAEMAFVDGKGGTWMKLASSADDTPNITGASGDLPASDRVTHVHGC
jgi:hypothetical protein